MYLRFVFVLVAAVMCLEATNADNQGAMVHSGAGHATNDMILKQHRPMVLPGRVPVPDVLIPENYPQEGLRPRREAEDDELARVARSVHKRGSRPAPSPTFPRPIRTRRFRREAEVNDEPSVRYVRSVQPYKPNLPRFPSTTFPRRGPSSGNVPSLPRTRFRREAEVNDEPSARYVRTLQPYKPNFPRYPGLPSPGTIPRPEDIFGGDRTVSRVRRGGGSVAVDVEKNRGSKSTTKVTAERNLYRSDNGRTRVDAGAYATNRGDRGGSINFSHRF